MGGVVTRTLVELAHSPNLVVIGHSNPNGLSRIVELLPPPNPVLEAAELIVGGETQRLSPTVTIMGG